MHCSKLKVPGKAQKLGGQLLKADEELGLLNPICSSLPRHRVPLAVTEGLTGQ